MTRTMTRMMTGSRRGMKERTEDEEGEGCNLVNEGQAMTRG